MMTESENRSIFAGYHPIINYIYFGYAVLIPILFMHPFFLAASFTSALAWSIYLSRERGRKFGLRFVLPLMVISALFNPLFNHEGASILFYIEDNPVTLESILYGAGAAVMIGGVILCFACYNAVMTSDKFIYIFGRIVPAMSLIISMALRFVPRYKAQAGRIASARRGIGFDVSSGKFFPRIRSGGEILSVMITWALENAIETSDSMRSRGYGLPGRTAYSIYRLGTRDRLLLLLMLPLMAASVSAVISGAVSVLYFPVFTMTGEAPFAQIVFGCHAAICFLPFALDIREDALWKIARSKVSAAGTGLNQ
jgi:energy-coupling factor transport system permease protein